MHAPRARRLQLSHVLVPVVTVVCVTAIVIASLLSWSTDLVDEAASQRQRGLVELVLDQSLDRVAHDQESSTVWDDSVRQLQKRIFDLEWIDNNLGVWFSSYYGDNRVYIVGADGRPVYAMLDGKRVAPQSYREVATTIAPLLRQLRGKTEPEQPRDMEVAMLSPGVADLAVIGGHPAIVSLKPIVSDSGLIEQPHGSEYVHVSVRYLDGLFLKRLEKQYGFEDSRFSKTPATTPERQSVELKSRAGTPIGYITWQPFTPGKAITARVGPALLVALLLIGTVVALLMQRLRRSAMELQASEAHAHHLAFHDVLTGLPNRALFDDRLEVALAGVRRDLTPFALLYLDLDRFKQVNDTLGHPAGDDLIREVARRLTFAVREVDTVSRLGGDEFAIIQANVRNPAEVEVLCHRIIEALAEPFDLLGGQAFVGISMGIALAPKHGNDKVELTRKADIALYSAKKDGKGRFSFFDDSMDANVRERQGIERELRAALLAGDQLRVHYQPVFCAKKGRLQSVEALVRWMHPEKGLLSPSMFIPVAEEVGLITTLGDWVLETACTAARDWPVERVSVNVSVVQLRDENFVERVASLLQRLNFDPRRLELEITESCFIDVADGCQPTVQALRGLGISIALDDFGTGYSSLSHLHQFQVDRIKIDRSFVNAIDGNGSGSAIIEALVQLAHATHLTITAEGVETFAQRRFLSKIGCDELQGFLLSRPLSEDGIDLMLQTSARPVTSE